MNITEGYMPFRGYQTYYRIAGDPDSKKIPLVLLHGGPGSTHNYMELFDCLAADDRMIISYDQLGCGNSYVEGRPDLWTADTWVDELEALRMHLGLKTVHLLGQSWGGMLAITYISDRKPEGIQSVILSSTLPSSQLWGKEQHRMIKFMSQEDQDAIARGEATGNYDAPDYIVANDNFMERHCAGAPAPDAPECLRRPKRTGRESYVVAWGPNEFTPLGTLMHWDYTEKLKEWTVPALVVSGTNDLCTPLIAKTMYDNIPNAKWELFDGCRHMCFAEDTPRYMDMMRKWLSEHE